MDFNKNNKEIKISPSNWRGNLAIDISQYVALIVRKNKLKFHQDRTINNPPKFDENNYVKNSNFSLILSQECLYFFESELSLSSLQKNKGLVLSIYFYYLYGWTYNKEQPLNRLHILYLLHELLPIQTIKLEKIFYPKKATYLEGTTVRGGDFL